MDERYRHQSGVAGLSHIISLSDRISNATVQLHRYDRSGFVADRRSNRLGVDNIVGSTLGQYGRCTDMFSCDCIEDKGMVRHDNLVALADPAAVADIKNAMDTSATPMACLIPGWADRSRSKFNKYCCMILAPRAKSSPTKSRYFCFLCANSHGS